MHEIHVATSFFNVISMLFDVVATMPLCLIFYAPLSGVVALWQLGLELVVYIGECGCHTVLVLLATCWCMFLFLLEIQVATIFRHVATLMLFVTYIKPVVFCSHVGKKTNAQSWLCTTLLI
jgi:hypothetical protein